MGFTVISSGPLTTVQDLGRIGYQHAGFQTSGVLDYRAAVLANLLVGNKKEEAVLEATLIGPMLEFDETNIIAITGGDFEPKINGELVNCYRALVVKEGDVLSFGMPKKGCRILIAFAGGMRVSKVMNSYSTNIRCMVGGYFGRALKAMDVIHFKSPVDSLVHMDRRNLGKEYEKKYNDTNQSILRVVLGMQEDSFTQEGKQTFFTEPYTVTNESDRMGCKLNGKPVTAKVKADIISDGVPFGGIQIPSSGQPIIMLRDRQTIGGYAKIGAVCFVDIPNLVQGKMGDEFRFKPISVRKAQRLYKREEREYHKLEKYFKNS